MDFVTTTYGFIAHTLIVFTLGALVGKPLWEWVRTYFPWNKVILFCPEAWSDVPNRRGGDDPHETDLSE